MSGINSDLRPALTQTGLIEFQVPDEESSVPDHEKNQGSGKQIKKLYDVMPLVTGHDYSLQYSSVI